MRPFSAFTIALVMLAAPLAARADLKTYVAKPDASYKYAVESNHDLGLAKVINVKLTSQTWRGIEWTHWLSIIVPANVRHKDKAVLFISGGKVGDPAPKQDSNTAKYFLALATQTGSVVAVLQQVPNQPLFEGKNEDALIAMTFARFIETKEEDWPLLLPMVKSATRAMDAVQAVAKDRLNMTIDGFVVSGASKRGWTTWLTAAVDSRVIAIAPMVIDVLNFEPQLAHQTMSYGKLSDRIGDYEKLDLPNKTKTEMGKKLNAMVDPYNYLDTIKIPKLVLLGTNDPYWTVDASSFYFPHLKGSSHLYYEPNAGHGLGPGIVPTTVAFFEASMTGKTLPEVKWEKKDDGMLDVKWKDPAATATLWTATSTTRDFRKAKWTSSLLAGNRQAVVKMGTPKTGWTAAYVEVKFPSSTGASFGVCTEVSVVPKTLPFDEKGQAK